jgi:hypothetical protein
LAHESGINRTYLSGVERSERNVSIDNIARIARGLKVKPYALLDDRAWLGSVLQRQTCAHRRLSSWHNRKLRWKRTRRERMLGPCFKQCSSSAWSMPQAMLKHAEGCPVWVVRTTYGEREQIMCGRGQSCAATAFDLQPAVAAI